MGAARDRARALSAHQPWPEDFHRCPKCRSRRTVVQLATPAVNPLTHLPTLMGVCADCGGLWEAFPPGWKHDPVEGEPCDNCAFRPGSPEIADKAAWKSMLAKLKQGAEFKCHKGCPIDVSAEAGVIGFDEDFTRRYGRMCVGFLRAMQQWPDWLDNRFAGRHVLTKHDQDKLLGARDD